MRRRQEAERAVAEERERAAVAAAAAAARVSRLAAAELAAARAEVEAARAEVEAAAAADAACEATTDAKALRKEWENLGFKPGEDVDDFALRLNTLLQKMVKFGDATYTEERAVEKLFRCIPEKYK